MSEFDENRKNAGCLRIVVYCVLGTPYTMSYRVTQDSLAFAIAFVILLESWIAPAAGRAQHRFFAILLFVGALSSMVLGVLIDLYYFSFILPPWVDWSIDWLPRFRRAADSYIASSFWQHLEVLRLKYAACVAIACAILAVQAVRWRRYLEQAAEIIAFRGKEKPVRSLAVGHILLGLFFFAFGIFDLGFGLHSWRASLSYWFDFPAPIAVLVGLVVGPSILASAWALLHLEEY